MKDEIIFDPAVMENILIHEDRYFATEETRLDRVLEAVEALDEPHRAVVELIVWGRHSKIDVAEILGYSRQHIHSLWDEAQAVLKEELGEMLQGK